MNYKATQRPLCVTGSIFGVNSYKVVTEVVDSGQASSNGELDNAQGELTAQWPWTKKSGKASRVWGTEVYLGLSTHNIFQWHTEKASACHCVCCSVLAIAEERTIKAGYHAFPPKQPEMGDRAHTLSWNSVCTTKSFPVNVPGFQEDPQVPGVLPEDCCKSSILQRDSWEQNMLVQPSSSILS